MPYAELYPDERSVRVAMVARVTFARGVGTPQAATILERIAESSATMAACEIRVLGGAMARVPADATAFAHRQSRVMINVAAMYDPSTSERSEHAAWVHRALRRARRRRRPAPTRASSPTKARSASASAYPGATWERLAAAKAEYDPDNVFRLNQNIPPEG